MYSRKIKTYLFITAAIFIAKPVSTTSQSTLPEGTETSIKNQDCLTNFGIDISPRDPELIEDKDLILYCTVNNATGNVVEWSVKKSASEAEELRNGDGDGHIEVLKNGTLIIRAMTTDDEGIYFCNHTTSDGLKKIGSVILGGHIKLSAPKSVKFTEGMEAQIKCTAHAHSIVLRPIITWLINGTDQDAVCMERCSVENETSNDGISVTSILVIANISKADRTSYSCVAFNDATEEKKEVILRVRDRLAALWPFLGILVEVIIIVIILVIHEKLSKGEDFGEREEDDSDIKKKEEEKMSGDDGDMRMRSTKQ